MNYIQTIRTNRSVQNQVVLKMLSYKRPLELTNKKSDHIKSHEQNLRHKTTFF